MPTVELHDVVVEYGNHGYPVRPLDGLNAEIADGDLALLLGPSGSGKTTLMSCLGGILRPTGGRIVIDGRDLTAGDDAHLIRHRRSGVGLVFQSFNLIPSLTALDNVAIGLRMTGTRASAARRRATELLDQVGLAERRNHRPGQLSGGQQQRVAIARGLASGAPLLLADEPTANLDYVQAEAIIGLLRELAAPGRTVVVATHDDRLLPIADTTVQLAPALDDRDVAPLVELAAGEVLFEQGSTGNVVWRIESGRLEIFRRDSDGIEQPLSERTAGQFVGELGPLLGQPRSATVRAVVPTVVSSMSLAQFRLHTNSDEQGGGSEPDGLGS